MKATSNSIKQPRTRIKTMVVAIEDKLMRRVMKVMAKKMLLIRKMKMNKTISVYRTSIPILRNSP